MVEIYPTNDRGISPVIGVVLMVGIVVALGAVVGGAVLGLGTGVGDTAPSAQFDTEFNDDGSVTITHISGDSVNTEDITVNGNSGEDVFVDSNGNTIETLQAGDSGTFTPSNNTISVTWDSGETSATILSEPTPNNFGDSVSETTSTPTVAGVVSTSDGFESGTYTNTFSDFSSGGNSPTVTETNPADGDHRLELETTPTSENEEVSVLSNQISNTTGVTVDVNKYADDGGDNTWEAHFRNFSSGYSVKVYENSDGNVILEEQKDTEDTIVDNTTITTDMTENEWQTLTMSLDDGSVTASLGSDQATLNTERNWNQTSTYFSMSAINTNGDSKIGIGVDNYTMKTAE